MQQPVESAWLTHVFFSALGCKIKALRAKTNTYIKTPVRGEEPVFVITGRKEDVALAKREILSAAEHFSQIRAQRKSSALSTGPPTNVPGHTTIKVRVPYRVVGLVVGPKGATIKRIQQITNTYIVTPSRDKEPVFEVTGLPENVESARNEIQNHIALRTGGLADGDETVFNGDSLNDFRSSSIYNSSSFSTFHDSGINQLPQRSQSTDSFYFTSNGSGKISTGNDYNPINSPFSPKGFFFSEIPSPDRDYDSHSGSSGSSFEPTPPSPSIWAPEVGGRDNVSRVVGDHGGTFTRSSSITTSVITSLSNGTARPESPHNSLRRLRSEPMNGFSAFTPFSSSVTTISSQLSPTDTNTSTHSSTIGRPSSAEGTLNINNNNNNTINTNGGKKKDCIICYESEVVAALVPCGHNLFCMECANRIKEESSNCPVCQKQVSHVLRIFS